MLRKKISNQVQVTLYPHKFAKSTVTFKTVDPDGKPVEQQGLVVADINSNFIKTLPLADKCSLIEFLHPTMLAKANHYSLETGYSLLWLRLALNTIEQHDVFPQPLTASIATHVVISAKDHYKFLGLLKNLNEVERIAMLSQTRNVLPLLINSLSSLASIFKRTNEHERELLHRAMQKHYVSLTISTVIEAQDQFIELIQCMSKKQRRYVLETSGIQLRDVLPNCSRRQALLAVLDEDEKFIAIRNLTSSGLAKFVNGTPTSERTNAFNATTYAAIRDRLPAVIRTNDDLHAFFALNSGQDAQMVTVLFDRLPTIIHTRAYTTYNKFLALKTVFSLATATQRQALVSNPNLRIQDILPPDERSSSAQYFRQFFHQTLKTERERIAFVRANVAMLPTLINTTHRLYAVLEVLPIIEQVWVCSKILDKLPHLMNSMHPHYDGMDKIYMVFNAVRTQLPAMIKTADDFILACRFIREECVDTTYGVLQNDLPDMIRTLDQLTQVTQLLSASKLKHLLAALGNRFNELVPDTEAFLDYYTNQAAWNSAILLEHIADDIDTIFASPSQRERLVDASLSREPVYVLLRIASTTAPDFLTTEQFFRIINYNHVNHRTDLCLAYKNNVLSILPELYAPEFTLVYNAIKDCLAEFITSATDFNNLFSVLNNDERRQALPTLYKKLSAVICTTRDLRIACRHLSSAQQRQLLAQSADIKTRLVASIQSYDDTIYLNRHVDPKIALELKHMWVSKDKANFNCCLQTYFASHQNPTPGSITRLMHLLVPNTKVEDIVTKLKSHYTAATHSATLFNQATNEALSDNVDQAALTMLRHVATNPDGPTANALFVLVKNADLNANVENTAAQRLAS